MRTVPIVPLHDISPKIDGKHQPIRPVSGLAAELDATGKAVVLVLRDPENQLPFPFVLSPPAAAQLARQLRKAVKAYLRAEPKMDDQD